MKLYDRIKLSLLKRRLKRVKYVHLMFNDKFNKPFVEFLNRNFKQKEHLILCKRSLPFDFPKAKNVVEVLAYRKLNFANVDKIICHSLFDLEVIDYLYNHRDILQKKACWMIWGGDLYNAPRGEMHDYVRSNFRAIITDVDGDARVYYERYKSSAICYNAGYTFPITREMMERFSHCEHEKKKNFIIQVNNSCDISTLQMFDYLQHCRNENVCIITPLSYGQMEYREAIIEKGRSLFGDKFRYIDKMLSPDEYTRHLSQVDILILNQNRQQGLGNCIAVLSMGGKVFIRSEISTYAHFMNMGIRIYESERVKDMSYEELVCYDEQQKKANMDRAHIFTDELYLKKLWSPVFSPEF